MRRSDELAIRECLPTEGRGERGGEVAEVAQVGPYIYALGGVWSGLTFSRGAGVLVEEDGEEGLGAACVLDDLVGEEEGVCCGVVESAVVGVGGVGGGGFVGGVFEEED